jgi:co-chaperonin GroES (HSP10)
MLLKVGDKVLYSKFVGIEVTYRDIDYLVMKESEVLALLGQDNDEKE